MAPEKARALLASLGPSLDPLAALQSWRELTPKERERVQASGGTKLQKAEAAGVYVRSAGQYQGRVSEIDPPPLALFHWGEGTVLSHPCLAIVGTREASTYGLAAALSFAKFCAAQGVTIVSGGALGIDAAAHRGALEVGGATVAVLGTGIDKPYPAQHAPLLKQISKSGLVLSQFPLGTPSYPNNFLLRNRLIAATADAILVIEAPERSGAMSTATAAAELNRPVFVVPGNITNYRFKGSHALIREGASLVDSPAQIMEELGWGFADAEPAPPLDDPAAEALRQALLAEPLTAEAIAMKTGQTTEQVLTGLTLLELEGLVLRTATGYALKS